MNLPTTIGIGEAGRGIMGRGTRLIAVIAVSGIAGCGGSLTEPQPPAAEAGASIDLDAGAPIDFDAGAPAGQDAGSSVSPDAATPDFGGFQQCMPVWPGVRVEGTVCEFLLPSGPECRDPAVVSLLILVGDIVIPYSPNDGWTYASETTFELHGGACELANRSPTGVVIHVRYLLV